MISSSAPVQRTPEASQLRQYLAVLKRRGWLIIVVPILTVAVVHVLDARAAKLYRASMGIIVAQAGGTFQPQVGNQALTQTMTNVLASDVVAQRVIDRLHLSRMTSTDLLNGLKVNVKPSSSVLDVTYDSHHKAKALAVLQGISVVFGDLVRRDLGVTNNLHRPGPLLVVANVFDPPHLEPTPVSPKPKKDAVYAAVLGLGIGVVLAFFAESIDDRIRSRREAEEAFGAPVVAAIPRRLFARPGREPDALELTMTGPMRLLRANIQIARPESNDPLSVLVTSVQSDSTTTAMIAKNLGASLALAGERVVYVDAGMHPKKSGKASSEQADNRPGLADVLTGEASIEDVVQEVHLPGYATNSASGNGASSNGNSADLHGQLFMIPAGTTKMDSPAVDSAKLDSLLGRLWKIATYVIIDAPPVTGADAVPLVASADNVLIVAKVGETTRARANTVREILARLGSRHVGVVLAVPSIRSAPRLN